MLLAVVALLNAATVSAQENRVSLLRNPNLQLGMSSPEQNLQAALVWTDHYDGPIDGNIGHGTVEAIKAFQTELGHAATGTATLAETQALFDSALRRIQETGFRVMADQATGLLIGIPTALLTPPQRTTRGTNYISKTGTAIIGLRLFTAPASLSALYDQLRQAVGVGRVEYSVLRDNWFVIAGSDGAHRIYIRYYNSGSLVTGFFAIYEADVDQQMITPINMMSFTLTPFASPPQVSTLSAADWPDMIEPAKIFQEMQPQDASVGQPSDQTSTADVGKIFKVAGISLGSRPQLDGPEYRSYECMPSDQFDEFTTCQKTSSGKERRGSFRADYSILRSRDGTAVYINRYQEPAFFDPGEVTADIDRLSRRFGAKPQIITTPTKPGLPNGILASWGMVRTEPLDTDSVRQLAAGKSVRRGYLVDFLGNFVRSAREGLPIYRLTGGAGFIWVASYDDTGRGMLRFAAVDTSAFMRPTSATYITAGKSDRGPPPDPGPQQSLNADILNKDQRARDALFEVLKANGANYTFEYFVINLPAGALPGIDVSVPVSHIRFSSTVFFDFNSSTLDSGAEAPILDLGKTLLKDKSYRSILVVGHTDAIGTHEYNAALSIRRAAAVAARLRVNGIKDEFLGLVPMAERQPVATNSTPEGRALNRRVEFFISDVPEATQKAIELVSFNPCFRSTQPADATRTDCAVGDTRVPLYSRPDRVSRPCCSNSETRCRHRLQPGGSLFPTKPRRDPQ